MLGVCVLGIRLTGLNLQRWCVGVSDDSEFEKRVMAVVKKNIQVILDAVDLAAEGDDFDECEEDESMGAA